MKDVKINFLFYRYDLLTFYFCHTKFIAPYSLLTFCDNYLAFKQPGGLLMPLHKPAISPYLKRDYLVPSITTL